METDSKIVLDLTDKMPRNHLTLFARLRNGCAYSGSYLLGKLEFSPWTNFEFRDNIIQHADKYHKSNLLEGLKALIVDPSLDDVIRKSALQLAGFLKYPELGEDIVSSWELIEDKDDALTSVIWAAVHCTQPPFEFLSKLIQYWKSISNEPDSYGWSPRSSINQSLSFAFEKGLKEEVIRCLIDAANDDEDIKWSIAVSLERVDSPSAIEFVVEEAADILKRIEGTDRFSPWTIHLSDYWNTSLSYGRRLSEASTEKLIELWQDSDDPYIKKQAFRMWVVGTNTRHIGLLQKIPSNSVNYKMALSRRIQLGDYSVVPEIISIISEDHYWLRDIYRVWCPDIRAIVERYLESFKDNIPIDFSGGTLDPHWSLSELLIRIPREEAEELLEKYWEHLGYSPKFIQCALYVGAPKTLELAATKIAECPADKNVFEHISVLYGFLTYEKNEYISLEHLKNLSLYLDKLDNSTLRDIAGFCQKFGFDDWSNTYLVSKLTETDRKRYYPTDEDILNDLDKFESNEKEYIYMVFWLDDLEKILRKNSRIMRIIDRWLSQKINFRRMEIASNCIKKLGTRKDIELLYKYKDRIK